VNLNYFGDKHGKSSRDQHFSILTTFLKNAHITKQLKSTRDVIEALEIEQMKSNETRKDLGLEKIQTKFLGTFFNISETKQIFIKTNSVHNQLGRFPGKKF
jgi:hypothetical protein